MTKSIRFFSLIAIVGVSFSPLLTLAVDVPAQPLDFVSDFAEIIPENIETRLNEKLDAVKTSSLDAEIAVVTVQDLGGADIESYATELYRSWGIGARDNDRGALLLLSVDDRTVRIETGYGLEGDLTDIESGRIIRDVITPELQKGNYGVGIENGVLAMVNNASAANDENPAQPEPVGVVGDEVVPEPTVQPENKTRSFDFLLPFMFIFVPLGTHFLARTKSWWLGGIIGAIIGGTLSLIFIPSIIGGLAVTGVLTLAGLIIDFILSKIGINRGGGGPWISPGGFGGGFGGGSSGGGFGGFGGGSSGGGGASGRW